MGAIGLIGTLAATGIQLYGQSQQQGAVEAAAKYNAKLKEQEALNTEAETREAIIRQTENNRAQRAAYRVALGGSGDRSDTGTAPLILADIAGKQQLSIADAARASAMEAASLRAQGKMGLWEAEQQGRASRIAMVGTAIQGVTSAFGKYQEGKSVGIYPRLKSV